MFIVIAVVIVIAAVTGIIFYQYSNRFVYNKENDVGNTTGNLYNGGMFCVYKGYVYFSNPSDNGKLYRMKEDGSEVKRICTDSVSCLNICNDYIYYVKDNMIGDITFVSQDMLHGISRLKIGDSEPVVIHQGISDALLLQGNNLYFHAYGKSTGSYYVQKAGIDGKSNEKLYDESYAMLDYYDGKIFFANTKGNHNLMYYTVDNGSVSDCYAGNFYMPDCEDGFVYYIDLDNDHKLTRMGLNTLETEVLCEDRVVKYNVNSKTGDIYYQAENTSTDHMLCRMKIDGSDRQIVLEGDYTDINFTEEHVYFYKMLSGNYVLYRASLPGGVPEEFTPPAAK